MPITINGSGTLTGISVGGLENGCVNEADLATAAVTNSKLASNAVTVDKMGTTEQSQLCKAWVNFNGTSTVAIRASCNVSSITDNGVGDYTVNFTTAMPDANYALAGMCNGTSGWSGGNSQFVVELYTASSPTSSACRIYTKTTGGVSDVPNVNVAIFR